MRITRRAGLLSLVNSIWIGMVFGDAHQVFGQSAKLSPPNDIVGGWHYRSFLNNPQKVSDLNTLLFGEGDFTFDESPAGQLVGTGDFGGGDTVKFQGSVTHGSLITIRFQGAGTGSGNSDWLYDYLGVFVPAWPNGAGQVPAIVGSVVRSAPHSSGSGGIAQAGKVGSFIAVKK
jgi:hypothetical protein